MKHVLWTLAVVAAFLTGFAVRPKVIQPPQPTIDGMGIQEYAVSVRRAEDAMFITRHPATGLILDCGEWYNHRKHTFGFYNCAWVDPKHAHGPAQLRP